MADPTDSITFNWQGLFPALRKLLGKIFGIGGAQMLVQLAVPAGSDPFQDVAESTDDYAAERAAELVGMKWDGKKLIPNPNPEFSITENTRKLLRATVVQALKEGWGASKLRDAIIDNYGFSPARSLMIARTERQLAQNKGALKAAKASGVVTRKRWVLASEHPMDDECDENDHDGWIPVDEDFTSGDDAPPAHPNCACNVEFSTQPHESFKDQDEDEDDEDETSKLLKRNQALLSGTLIEPDPQAWFRDAIRNHTNGNGHQKAVAFHQHHASACRACGKIWRNCNCPLDGREVRREGYCEDCRRQFLGGIEPPQEVEKYGTAEGAIEAWNTRGRGKHNAPSVKLKRVKDKLFIGKPVPVPKSVYLTKDETGKLGEKIALGYLRGEFGAKDADTLNIRGNNFPIDMMQDHELIEVKAGQSSNVPTAQHWRMTFSMTKEEKAWLKKQPKERQKEWRDWKQQQCYERKTEMLKEFSDIMGHTVRPITMTAIVNNKTKTADLFRFRGFHQRITWRSPEAAKAYIGTFKYSE